MISTPRLDLVPATPELLAELLEGPEALTVHLGARVPSTWPPEHVDGAALQYLLDRLLAAPGQAEWWLYFVVGKDGEAAGTVLGTAGFKGPPDSDGRVEIGYSIVSEHQRRGYASEAVRGLLAHAFAEPAVRRVIAETLPELTPSIGVLHKCGFHLEGEGSEPGVIRYGLPRASSRNQ
jgi:ribosomal-protein-alanine N-acetyltransferase